MRISTSPLLRFLGRLALFAGVVLLVSALLLPMLRIHELDAALPEAAAKFQGFASTPTGRTPSSSARAWCATTWSPPCSTASRA